MFSARESEHLSNLNINSPERFDYLENPAKSSRFSRVRRVCRPPGQVLNCESTRGIDQCLQADLRRKTMRSLLVNSGHLRASSELSQFPPLFRREKSRRLSQAFPGKPALAVLTDDTRQRQLQARRYQKTHGERWRRSKVESDGGNGDKVASGGEARHKKNPKENKKHSKS